MELLKDKIAIITGAGTGIGKGIARAFGREGAKLVIASRKEENLNAAAEELRPQGVEVLVVRTDVTDEEQVAALFARTMDVFGRVDILVNNSGVFDGGPLEELSLETWQKVIGVNLTGPFLCSREAMKIMKKQRGGRILNIGSISAQMPRMNAAPYATSKHGLVGLTKSTALEGRAFGVVASALHPGNTVTERRNASDMPMDQEPMMTVDELAMTAVTMAAAPPHVNVLEAIVLPVEQEYIGRG
ncbi:MAG: SDR family oxidoreductase [Planctomycetota bacterium]|jgi:NAD(P)-dependent dehydrogenase (short-subunit alcohol dehydrogenase family)|nr:SDR family oxidoreductase [Planctomycetota bacterium]MDP7132647.1 SDR family oxidoreductase [Planctomycetota bacterium]MDP7254848.1 SDR family oxidoreductase [Planctomycetota bacterium]